MEEAGQKLKRTRERLNLRYRDVEEASNQIATRHSNDEFVIALSRLSDIENKGTVPTIYRLYSLCTIYRLDINEVLDWYGVNVATLAADAASIQMERTHLIGFGANGYGDTQMPLALDPGIDLRRTTFLSRMIQRWGKLPLTLLNSLDMKSYRYAFIGSEDWTMYPLIPPSTLILIDDTHRKVVNTGWANEFERPIYFFEHRKGFACGWCTLQESQLVLQPHPASMCYPEVFSYPTDIDVLGQVVGVAMRLDQGKRRRNRT
jgi:transcriptional regulator with XRE-family HTH domain